MESVLLVIHLIVSLSIVAVVLLQPAESGGFLGNSGSLSNMMMPRRTGDVLSRLTTILVGCFFLSSLLLAIYAGKHNEHKSILDVAGDTTSTSSSTTATPSAKDAPVQAPVLDDQKDKKAQNDNTKSEAKSSEKKAVTKKAAHAKPSKPTAETTEKKQ